LRERVVTVGMRNSNVMAIAPTATISNIVGVAQSIEPAFRNLYVKANMSGDFTVVNPFLVHDLKERGLWDEVMISDLKYFDGVLGPIDRVPEELKALYATAFEIDAHWLVEAAPAGRNGSTRRSRSISIWRRRTAGSSTRSIGWRGSGASRPPITCAHSRRLTSRNRRSRARTANSTPCPSRE
jgi:ribonucleoside-diphosphate reductase alpha chain